MDCDELELIDACIAGRQDAFHALVERFSGLVFGVCLRMLADRQEAEDVAQEVFLRTHRSLASWDRVRPFRGWILAIAANRCRTYLSKRRRRPMASEMVEDVADPRPQRDDAELRTAIWSALDELRADYRQVFLLFHEQGLNYEEMSLATGRPVGTLKTWLHRARAELLALLRSKGLTAEERHDRSQI